MWNNTRENIQRFHCGQYFDTARFMDFIDKNGFNRYSMTVQTDYKRFLQTGRALYGYPHIIREYPPYMDHGRSFKNTTTGAVCIVSQPYREATEIEAQVKAWAAERGIEADVYDASHSWYYPGHTCLIVFHLPGVGITVPSTSR